MSTPVLSKNVMGFLSRLKKNNNREWFNTHKKEFQEVQAEAKSFYEDLMEAMKMHDDIEKLKMFRIYRDVRFSKDKTPYQPHFAGSFSRAGAHLRGGYYLRIRPGESFIAAGFWDPNKEDIYRIRKEFEVEAAPFRKVINEPGFKKIWGDLQGDSVKTAPKGFDKQDPNIDLIRQKQFIFVRNFKDSDVSSAGFFDTVNDSFKAIRPYFDLMSEILTTDLNGQSLL